MTTINYLCGEVVVNQSQRRDSPLQPRKAKATLKAEKLHPFNLIGKERYVVQEMTTKTISKRAI